MKQENRGNNAKSKVILMAKIIAVNISKRKHIPKKNIKKGIFKVNYGLVGDAHAGPGIRQVSLLAKESYDKFEKLNLKKVSLENGIFAENLTTQGIILHKLKIGTKLKINNVILEISKIGKECHTDCTIAKKVGSCIMPKEGVFAKVLKGGEIKVGDAIVVKK